MSHDIIVRKVRFPFSEDLPALWNPGACEWSHMVNGASFVMPYLEPFLVKTMREAMTLLEDPDLLEDARGFVGQEAQHYTNHRRYNEMLKRNGYPELEEVEESLDRAYARLGEKSLTWRLAYSAGFETMTMGITEWLINDRNALFKDADPAVSSLVLWHMVEETEHKSVAFEVFQAVSGSYWLRVLGLIYGSLHVGFLSRRGYVAMLKKDGVWRDPRSRLRLWRIVGSFYVKAGGAMLAALHPAHHPDDTADPHWIEKWRRAHADMSADELPMLNTTQGSIEPVKALS